MTEFSVQEVTDRPATSGNGKAVSGNGAGISGNGAGHNGQRHRPKIPLELPIEERPSNPAELSAMRVNEAVKMMVALGFVDTPRDSIAELAQVLSKHSELPLELWLATLNGHGSFIRDVLLSYLDRIGCPLWVNTINWAIFCIHYAPDEKKPDPTLANLVPVFVFLDPEKNELKIKVPDGYRVTKAAEAQIRDKSLYVEVSLARN